MVILIASGFGLSLAAVTLYLLRKDHLHIGHGVGWGLAIFVFAFLGGAPWIVDSIAASLGVGYPPIIAVMLAFGAIALKLLLMDIARTKMEIRQQRMIQKLAILEADLRDINKKPALDD